VGDEEEHGAHRCVPVSWYRSGGSRQQAKTLSPECRALQRGRMREICNIGPQGSTRTAWQTGLWDFCND
jgi:hypothetical protein